MVDRSFVKLLVAFVTKDAKLYFSYRLAFLLNLLSILFGIATYFFLGETVSADLEGYGTAYFPYVLIGIAGSSLLLTATGGLATTLSQELRSGTLETILATPHSPLASLVAMSAWNFVYSIIITFVYLAVAQLWFNLEIRASGLFAAGLILTLSLLAFYALGLIAAACVLKFKRGNPIQWLMSSVQVLLGGVYFPIEQLPLWIKKCALLLPLVHCVEGLRSSLLLGHGVKEQSNEISLLLLLAALLLPLALLSLKQTISSIRKHGTFLQH